MLFHFFLFINFFSTVKITVLPDLQDTAGMADELPIQ